MEEKQITVDGETKALAAPFFVIATQNPVENTGTFQLPEAQLDRFLLRLKLGYPKKDESLSIIDTYMNGSPLVELEAVASGDDIIAAQAAVQTVRVSSAVADYIVRLVESTRTNDDISLGISTRGMLAMVRACQAYAAIAGRDYVLPDDVKALAEPVFAHRLILKSRYGAGTKAQEFVETMLHTVPAPTESPDSRL
jgi:MoxR-like ATPase